MSNKKNHIYIPKYNTRRSWLLPARFTGEFRKNFGRIPEEFRKNSTRIPEEFRKNPRKIPEEFQKNIVLSRQDVI